ncbi:hypothetical protein SAMN05443667_101267 [Flavobacterium gillisiae]|uniref:Uncharacterized protein n=1 Tax=Flavobacterium gillisiae TaxID=150146 RepID=A0A1H3WX66_9FLAO|nr:hypothetical protein [Flavobacterium gillisiae]SDZ91311.1 hypothetical protein SAMN05443667_101267 [Flavobacterium gillisiae]
MYLQLITYIAYFFAILFIAFLFYALEWAMLKRLWQNAQIKAKNNQDKKEFIKKQEEKGLKPFAFNNGNTVIYARTGNQALLDYKQLQAETKIVRKKLKKA